MPQFTGSELLLYGGLALMAVSAITAVITGILFRISGHRLKKRLEAEFGKRRH